LMMSESFCSFVAKCLASVKEVLQLMKHISTRYATLRYESARATLMCIHIL
jgi:hypothetical protein